MIKPYENNSFSYMSLKKDNSLNQAESEEGSGCMSNYVHTLHCCSVLPQVGNTHPFFYPSWYVRICPPQQVVGLEFRVPTRRNPPLITA